MNEASASGWDAHAHTYARIAAPCTGYLAQSLFLHVAGRLPSGADVLDVACGNGELSRAAVLHAVGESAASDDHGRVTATDTSPAMVDRTKRQLTALANDSFFECSVQDGQALEFEPSSFDAVFSAFGIFLFPDRRAGWREAARVLRPGGILATAVWRGPEVNELVRLQMEPVLAALPARVLEDLPRAGWLDIATEDGLRAEISGCGFEDAEICTFDAVLTAPSPRAMWAMMEENPLSGAMLSGCSVEERAALEDSALLSFKRRAGGADRPVRFGASCHFLTARRADVPDA